MTDSLASRVQSVNGDKLTPIAQQAAGHSGALTRWEVSPLKIWEGGMGQNVIYRFSGGIQGLTGEVPWSVILKVSSAALTGRGPQNKTRSDYAREYEFYRSGMGKLFPAGFRAARCYAQQEQVNEEGLAEYWLWLEDLAPYTNSEWSLENNYQAALALGKFNGVFLDDRPLQAMPWLKTNYVERYMEMAAPYFQHLFAQRDLPLMRRIFPPAEADSLTELWQRREEHLKTLQRLPKTFCHGDAQYTNLFLIYGSNGSVETAAIDWEGACMGPIGTDPAQILMMSILKGDERFARAICQSLYQGYLDGLQAVGWRGDPRLVRLGFTSSMFKVRLTYVLRPISFFNEGEISEVLRHWLESEGITIEEWADRSAWRHGFFRELFEESLALRDELF